MELEPPVRVVVADDHAPTRALVSNALRSNGFSVVGEAWDAAGAVAAVLETAPQLALLDIRMPGSGISAAAAIAAERPDTSIVMLTVSQDDDDLFGAIQAGASGYLVKGLDPEQLPHALRAVLAGEASLPGTLVARLVAEFRARGRRRFLVGASRSGEQLTDREWEVLQLLGEDFTTAQIAERLYIAKVTVRSHVSAVLRKLRVPDRDAAARLMRGSQHP